MATRRSEIISMLSDLSRDGWANARATDWKPLEAELDNLNAKLGDRT